MATPSTLNTWKPSGAGLTPLPPSPELRPNASQMSDLEPLPFSLGGINVGGISNSGDSPSRLRSIARYQAFSPQALACSDPIPSSAARETASSLGAVAGAQGVAVFRISKPHEPLLMLNHATSNNPYTNNATTTSKTTTASQQNAQNQSHAGGRPVTALAFQPDATRSLYLAAARGSGVLIWDVSGHSISPLLGRLAMDASVGSGGPTYASESDLLVTSLSWKLSTERDGVPLLATTTNYSASIWDLRGPVATAKPSIRFGLTTTRKTSSSNNSTTSVPYVQVACSRSHECATMDAAGTVRVFDIRMTDHSRYSMNSLSTFTAFGHRGVGISYLPAMTAESEEERSTTWVTWGLDSPDADAVVKVWSSYSNTSEVDPNSRSDVSTSKTGGTSVDESYWYMDGSPGLSGSMSPYRLVAQCSPPYHLACARVCPDPVENGIMTIGILDDNMRSSSKRGHEGWRAELWKIRPPTAVEMEANDGTFGMERLVAFNGGAVHDTGIESALGKNSSIGQLQAAELAITSSTTAGLQTSKSDVERIQESGQGELGLALCCLSDKGFVTTHFIPEALPRRNPSRSDGIGSLSPHLFSNVSRTKVFNDDREGGVMDAAQLWGAQGDRPSRPGGEAWSSVEWVRNQMQSPSPVKDSGTQAVGPQLPTQRNSDGGMLFEIEVPAVAYATVTTERLSGVQLGPVDLTSPKAAVAAAMVEETDNGAAHVRDVAAMAERMNNIETERIPCPRLSGAVFGPGVGGLAMFNNGDVKKMWLWYDRASPSRLTGIPSSISAPETVFSDPGSSKGPGSSGNHEPTDLKVPIPRDCPRTMKDLMDMTEAAKEAQWGEVNESGAADSDEQEQSSGDNFFEYMSTGSISSDSEDNEPVDFANMEGRTNSRYDSYFGNFRRPIAEPPGGSTKNCDSNEKKSQSSRAGSPVTGDKVQVVGPSSDTLASTVHVTHDFDKLALNNQSAQLASDWELGQWQAEEADDTFLVNPERFPQRALQSHQRVERRRDGGMLDSPASPPSYRVAANAGLPSYRGLTTSPTKRSNLPRSQSVQVLPPVLPAPNGQIENEPGVHGGEYAVRPNMQESMVFLRKLFSHQQQEGNGFPSLLSPPDSPMFQTRGKPVRSIAALEQLRGQGEVSARQPTSVIPTPDESRSRVQPGVYALGSDAYGTGVQEDDKKLSQIKTLCIHNAEVCERYGETGKQGVWKLLAQMVDRRLNERPDAFNGWGGKGGGALGIDLVSNIMRYYETLGDVQMLATMVCVLSGGRPRNTEEEGCQLHLLPTGHDEKYDTYIRRYSDLLFGWSLLIKRTELNKHLVQRVQQSEGNLLNATTNEAHSPGIALVFTCPRCGQDAEFGTNICRSCQDFAFRCSVCENGVRGLCIICDACGHGGHAKHVTTWFAKQSECPSGCGCKCTFTAFQQRRSVTEGKAPRSEAAGIPTFIDPLDD